MLKGPSLTPVFPSPRCWFDLEDSCLKSMDWECSEQGGVRNHLDAFFKLQAPLLLLETQIMSFYLMYCLSIFLHFENKWRSLIDSVGSRKFSFMHVMIRYMYHGVQTCLKSRECLWEVGTSFEDVHNGIYGETQNTFFFFVLPHSAKESLTEGAILKKVGRGPLLY